MRIILGIGNPGPAYQDTRHNCGFLVVEELARRHGVDSWQHRHHAQLATWRNPAGAVLLVKPDTFVNCSGESAQALLAFHKLMPAEMLVIVDDLHLQLGTLRLRPSGSAGGHNGLKDIEARLGQAYPRLRLGIGAPPAGGEVQVNHVLGRFSDSERPVATAMIARAADCVEGWLSEGCAIACRYNRGPEPASTPGVPSA